jgi:hypothetical protein
MALYKKFITGIIELGLTEEEIKKWQYCGGDYASHRNYFELRFPKKKFPDHVQWCVCGHYIKRNAYICNEAGDYNSILPIGSCCIKHFMENGMRRTCETCGVIHRNSTSNKCNKCRSFCCGFPVKKDGKCFECKKKEDIEKNHESCFQCGTLKRIGVDCSECRRIETLRRLNEPKKCECGKQIASHYKRCYSCNYLLKEEIEQNKKFCAPYVWPKKCHECNDTLVSYWSDDVYGPCMQCCCINCEKKVCVCVD